MGLDQGTNVDPVIDVALAQRLIDDQFPQWSHLPIAPVELSGHDNRTFHLGGDMLIRLPSAQRYVEHVAIEQQWLPVLAPQLPLPIPVPVANGEPSADYPWPFSINRWLPGKNATLDRIDDLDQFATDLAHFLKKLQRIDTSDAPPPGPHNFFRGGDLSVYDAETRACIDELHDIIDAPALTALWESAQNATCHSSPMWVHGDVAVGNLLVNNGRLCAVIDFGQLAAGDPACDLTMAWTFFTGNSRETFRSAVNIDESTWLRARAWALWKALLQLQEHQAQNHHAAAKAKRVIADVLAE